MAQTIDDGFSILSSSQSGQHRLIQFIDGKISFWYQGERTKMKLNKPVDSQVNFRTDITHLDFYSKGGGNEWISLGLKGGHVILYSLNTNEQMNLLTTEKRAITAVYLSDESLYCGDDDGNVYRFVIFSGVDKEGSEIRKAEPLLIKSGLGRITAMTVVKEKEGESMISVAVKNGVQVRFYSLDGNMLEKYSNFSFPPIFYLSVLYGRVLLVAEQQRNISVIFDKNNTLNLIALSKPVHVDVNNHRNTRNTFHVLCVDESGALNVWSISRKKKILVLNLQIVKSLFLKIKFLMLLLKLKIQF